VIGTGYVVRDHGTRDVPETYWRTGNTGLLLLMLLGYDLWYAVELVDVACKFLTRPITLSGEWFISDPWWI
jgi:hypothetical protein